jgi:hypothetical protein
VDWETQLAALNQKVQATFAPTDPVTGNPDYAIYTPVPTGVPAPFPITLLPLDPLRLEGVSPGNFTLRWAVESDFSAQSVVPGQGDVVTIDGADYTVEQIQSDLGGGIRLMLLKAPV